MADVTQILQAIRQGEFRATEDLFPAVYDELRRLAARKLAAEPPGQTLQATALVHEAYLRLLDTDREAVWDHRGHFFMAAAEAMRRILIDRARHKKTLKRGGDARRVELHEAELVAAVSDDRLLELNDAIERLAERCSEEARLVKLRYFAGLTLEDAASALKVSLSTATRYWAFARAYLQRAIAGVPDPG